MKGYRKIDGSYVEVEDSVPVSDTLVRVALRPSENYMFSLSWATDPMDPDVCWKSKAQPDVAREKKDAFDAAWRNDPKNDTLMLVLYELYKRSTGANLSKVAFWNAIKDRFADPTDKFFDF